MAASAMRADSTLSPTLQGIAWYILHLHCIALYCMVLHGITWYCMVKIQEEIFLETLPKEKFPTNVAQAAHTIQHFAQKPNNAI